MKVILKIFTHVICNLPYAMDGSIPDLWYWMLQVLHYHWDHLADLLNVINILTHLGEGHEASIFIPPISGIS